MPSPFPTSPAGRREAFDKMRAAAPGMPDSIAAFKEHFPDAKLLHFKAGDVEYGDPRAGRRGVVPATAPSTAEILAGKGKRK